MMLNDAVLGSVHAAMNSPWLYLVVFLFVSIDGFFPTIPGETLVVTCGVFAVTGEPSISGVLGVAALGGFVGDHVSYLMGRSAGARLLARARPGTRQRRPFDWASRALKQRGGSVLVVCRFIPGCRTAATLTTGTIGYPLRAFSAFAAIGAAAWSAYFTLVGVLGGRMFADNPVLGVALGIGFAVGVAVVSELVRRLRAAPAAAGPDGPTQLPPGPVG